VKKPVINKQITQSNVPQTYLAKEPVWTWNIQTEIKRGLENKIAK
jgi:hypothetical protein